MPKVLNKKRSSIWSYFKENGNNKATCTFCSLQLSYKGGSTYNLTRHVKTKHPHVFASMGMEVQKNEDLERKMDPEQDVQPSTSSGSNNLNPAAVKQCGPQQKTLTSTVIGSFFRKPISSRKKQELDKHLVETIVKDLLPFQIVESVTFKRFIYKLCPEYQMPSRKTVSTVLVPQLYNMERERVRKIIEATSAVCLTTDGWTSMCTENYISVTSHFFDINNELKMFLLDCYKYDDSHTSNNLASELKRIAEEWNIQDKVVAIASDNAANIVAAIKQTEWKHIPCFAHTLNLIVQDSLKEISDIKCKIKSIVEFFKRSVKASESLKRKQEKLSVPVLSLKQDVTTRWNSTFLMFKRILEVKNPYYQLLH